MAEKREGIKALIQEYYEKVRHNIKCPSYTLDLALNPDLDISRVQIVELNGPVCEDNEVQEGGRQDREKRGKDKIRSN